MTDKVVMHGNVSFWGSLQFTLNSNSNLHLNLDIRTTNHQQTAEAETSDRIDRALDRRLQSIAEKWGASSKPFILESRLAGWLAGESADLRIWLDAPEEVRVDRIADREETEAEMRVREVSEAGRYQAYYDIALDDREFYDLHINTARWDKDGVYELVKTAIQRYDPETDEGAFETPAVDL